MAMGVNNSLIGAKIAIRLKKCKSNLSESSVNIRVMGIKPGPKRIAKSTGKPDRRQRDNKSTPGNTPSLKPHNHKKGD